MLFALPLAILLMYILPPFFVLSPAEFREADWKVVMFAAISIFSWCIVFKYRSYFAITSALPRISLTTNHRKIIEIFSWLLVVIPTICFWAQSGELPIWAAIKGYSPDDIYTARINWDLVKSGWIVIPLYVYIVATSAILPFWILLRFKENSILRWILLILASILLVAGFSKTSYFKIVFPILFYFLYKRKIKEIILINSFSVGFFLIVSFLFHGGVYRVQNGGVSELFNLQFGSSESKNPFELEEPYERSERNFLLGAVGLPGIVNRIAWIPYVTGKKWLNYYEAYNLADKQPIISNRSLAFVLSAEHVPLESLIFNYQFGIKKLGVYGLANTSYFIDSWVKFGWLGFIISVFLTPIFLMLTFCNFSAENRGLLLFSIFMLIGNGFLNMLLAGGALMLLCVLFDFDFSKEKQ